MRSFSRSTRRRATRSSIRLRPWRHLLAGDSKAITLAMRYGGQIGQPAATEAVTAFYARLDTEKRRLQALIAQREPASLASAARTWRRLAVDARAALARTRPMTVLLAAEYGQDARTIDAFLADAAAGGGARLDARGGFAPAGGRTETRRPRRPQR